MTRTICRLALYVLLVAECPLVARAQYFFDSWTTDNGLPQNSVNSILQTHDGFLWLATGDGLVRYDGARFTIFNRANTPGMNANRCDQLLETRDGTLWILTDLGLTSYRDRTFHSYTIQDGLPEKIGNEFESSDDGLILAARDGLYLWRVGQRTLLFNATVHPDAISFAYQDRAGAIWFAASNGVLNRLENGTVVSYQTTTVLPRRQQNDRVTAALEDSQGRFWFGTTAGLARLDGEKITRYLVQGLPAQAAIVQIFEDQRKSFWISTETGELYRMTLLGENGLWQDSAHAEIIAYHPGSQAYNRVQKIYGDREGTIWLGTTFDGLKRINKQLVRIFSKQDGLSVDNVYPIYQDREGAVWIGSWEGRLNRYANGKFTYYGDVTLATAIDEDREGGLWVGKNSGLVRYMGREAVIKDDIIGIDHPYEVTAIYQDVDETMWFGTSEGLIKYRQSVRTHYTTADGLAGDQVKAIIPDGEGGLWLGTYGGLSRLRNGVFTSYRTSDGLGSNHIRALYRDNDGVLWIGTYDGGLSRFANGRFVSYSTKDGLFSDGVFQILDDERGNLWISSNLGIYRVNRQQLNDFAAGQIHNITCVSYGKRDGLLNIECNGGTQPAGTRTRDGLLWFPTQRGVAVIDPAQVSVNNVPPPVAIEEFLIDGIAKTNSAIRIGPDQERLEIDYAGLSFIKPENVHFRYKLEGLENDWVEAGTRRAAFYSHLPPGSYRFRVVAANADGVWNLQGATIEITVVPPFWRSWWFVLLLAFTVITSVTLLYRRRVQTLQRAKLAQEAFSRQLIELQEAERKRLAAELHDSLGQSLSIIVNRADLLLGKPQDQQRTTVHVGEIASTASEAIREVREIAYRLRPVELDRLGLTKALRSMMKKVSTATGIRIEAQVDEIDDLFDDESEINLYRIVQESISNIVKHAEATAAEVTVRRDGDSLALTIHDNGKGFNPARAQTDGGFGLKGLAERVRILGGRHQLQSAPGQGSTLSVVIDLRQSKNGR
jgi:signal transduction histidine kinase/ligand-binding sensor domain-containing protein